MQGQAKSAKEVHYFEIDYDGEGIVYYSSHTVLQLFADDFEAEAEKWINGAPMPVASSSSSSVSVGLPGSDCKVEPTDYSRLLDIKVSNAAPDRLYFLFKLPDRKERFSGPKHDVDSDLKFYNSKAFSTIRSRPKNEGKFFKSRKRHSNEKFASFILKRKKLVNSSLSKAVKGAGAGNVMLPFGFNMIDQVSGLTGWVLEIEPGTFSLHGGPHPPVSSSMVVELDP